MKSTALPPRTMLASAPSLLPSLYSKSSKSKKAAASVHGCGAHRSRHPFKQVLLNARLLNKNIPGAGTGFSQTKIDAPEK